MAMTSNEDLVEQAKSVLNPRTLRHEFTVGDVGCALVTDKGHVYLGVSIDICSGIGFCAEHSAIAAMVTHGEHRIRKIVAVAKDGTPIPPCGRCRELMHQIHEENFDTEVIVGKGRSVKLKDLLPFAWDAKG
jgi:cytidine deaminase